MKIGLLPLYVKLYDDVAPDVRPRMEAFYEKIAVEFEKRGVEVVRTDDFARLKDEFKAAVTKFEREGVDAIVTLHIAYSPSLESIGALCDTDLPIIVLDTTETLEFTNEQSDGEIMYNHGIHGVMDMTNMLLRRGKAYAIAAGHFPQSDVIEKTARLVKAAAGAKSLKGSRVGTIGGSFDGMGDFLISDEELLETFGVTAVYSDGKTLTALQSAVTEEEIEAEIEKDLEMCQVISPFTKDTHAKTVRNCLAVRKWIENEDLGAFTVNFREIRPSNGLSVMPFMEACKAMARGTGYAGEGDVLTAAITGALLRGFKDAAFIEIFCPDWKGGSLCLSHMGEFNLALAGTKPEIKETDFIFGEADNPVVCYGCYKGGDAVFINVFKGPEGYNMLISPVEMLSVKKDNYQGSVRGWMKPKMPLGDFLSEISRHGVTHHSALVYGAELSELEFFGKIIGLNVITVK